MAGRKSPPEGVLAMAAKPPDGTPVRRAGEPATTSSRTEIGAFLKQVKDLGPATGSGLRGRLVFALDATMSRQPLWDTACKLQSDMFREAASIGGLDVQLVYYRGLTECRASPWVSQAERLGELMTRIDCRGGHTQIRKVIAHARKETEKAKVQALVFVGDAMEEKLDDLCQAAGELGLLGVPAFMFQEGYDPVAEQAFRELARLTKGAYCRFDPGAAHELGELLRAVAAYAAGGMRALADLSARRNAGAIKLIEQMR
ncbi:MAG: VWA domain-containing protein [Xanthobacteraceae bacterium]